jgi:aspartate aminotransferase
MLNEQILEQIENGSAIRAMFEGGKLLAAQFGAENVYDFSLGNPNVPAPSEVREAMKQLLDSEDPTTLHGYMSNAGFEDVREAVASSLNQRFGTDFNFSNIMMCVGAAGGLNCAFKTLLNPGDEVITFAPFFTEYRNYLNNYGAVLKAVAPNPPTFQPDLEAFEALFTPKTKVVLVNTPNNPTGVIYSAETIKKLAAIMEAKEREFGISIYLISDEPYRELAYDGVEVPYLTKYYHNTLVDYSYSKSLSLPGERIGYLVIPDTLDEADRIKQGCAVANRLLGFVNAPSLQQKAVALCLDAQTDIATYDRNRTTLYEALTSYGFECVRPEGAFYLFVKSPVPDEAAFCAAAQEEHILFVPMSGFGCPGYVRIAYCASFETIERSLPAFERLAARYF